MAYGLQVFDSSGNLTLDTGRFTRFINEYTISIGDGQPHDISCTGIVPNGDWMVIPQMAGTDADDSMYSLAITILPNIIRLQFPKGISGMQSVIISIMVLRY